MRKLIATLSLLCLLVLPAAALAHPGHDHKLMGTISAIDGSKVTVKSTDGKEQAVELSPATKITHGKTKGDAADLKVGMRVVVVADGEGTPMKAKELQYSAAAATAKK
jgi:hypothetical protein